MFICSIFKVINNSFCRCFTELLASKINQINEKIKSFIYFSIRSNDLLCPFPKWRVYTSFFSLFYVVIEAKYIFEREKKGENLKCFDVISIKSALKIYKSSGSGENPIEFFLSLFWINTIANGSGWLRKWIQNVWFNCWNYGSTIDFMNVKNFPNQRYFAWLLFLLSKCKLWFCMLQSSQNHNIFSYSFFFVSSIQK